MKVPNIDKDVKECVANIKGEINAIQKKIPKTRGRENDGLKKARKGLIAKLRKLEELQEELNTDSAIDKNSKRFYKRENKILFLYPKAKISLASFVQSYSYMLTISPRHFGE